MNSSNTRKYINLRPRDFGTDLVVVFVFHFAAHNFIIETLYILFNYKQLILFFYQAYINTFTTTYAISVYHQLYCEFESRSGRGVLDTILCDKVCQWFSLGSPVSSTSKTDHHDLTI